MASVSSHKRPGTGHSSSQAKHSLLCNKCRKPLQTTCFLCSCECIFCEDCTYSHFERSSSCPSCRATLSENDFTELVVADATNSPEEMVKTNMQGLFQRSTSSTTLPFADLCMGVLRQIEATKKSTKFVLKQLVKDSNMNGRQSGSMVRSYESLKEQYTKLQQQSATQRLQLEQANKGLQDKVQSQKITIAEQQNKIEAQQKMLEQFRRIHGGMTAGTPSSRNGNGHRPVSAQQAPAEPPLNGILMQREARDRAQQQAYQTSRAPSVLGNSVRPVSMSNAPVKRTHSFGHSSITPIQTAPRPYSSNSAGSFPGTPRIREGLSSSAGYRFQSSSSVGNQNVPGGQHINKRRKPSSSGGMPSVHQGMSPSLAFTANHGPHSGRGPQYPHHRG